MAVAPLELRHVMFGKQLSPVHTCEHRLVHTRQQLQRKLVSWTLRGCNQPMTITSSLSP